MSRSADLKLAHAEKKIDGIVKSISENPPIRCHIVTDFKKNNRRIGPWRDFDALDQLALESGDAIHALRTAIDHAYVFVVKPYLKKPAQHKLVQFPFCQDPEKVADSIKNRFAHLVSQDFFDFIYSTKPFSGPNGNKFLSLIQEYDNIDKHNLLIPTAELSSIESKQIRRFAPDFPYQAASIVSLQAVWWATWGMPPVPFNLRKPPNAVATESGFYEFVDIPINVTYSLHFDRNLLPVQEALAGMLAEARSVVDSIRDFEK